MTLSPLDASGASEGRSLSLSMLGSGWPSGGCIGRQASCVDFLHGMVWYGMVCDGRAGKSSAGKVICNKG